MTLSLHGYAPRTGAPAGLKRMTSRSLLETIAETIPALLLVYLFILWPLAFGDSSETIAETALGWMAGPQAKDDSPLKLVAYPVLFAIGLVCFLGSGAYRRVPWLSPGVLLVLAIVGLAAASTVWSLFPGLTLRRSAVLFLTTSIVLFAAFSAGSFKAMMTRMFWVLFVVALINLPVAIIKDAPAIGHSGIYPHKNVFGYVAFLILVFGLHWGLTGRLLERMASVIMIPSALFFLWVSLSKTSLGLSLICPLAGLELFVLARYLRWSPAFVFAGSVIVVLGMFWAGQQAGVWTFASLNEAIFGNSSLTGRTYIWEFAAERIAERPLLGFGYEAVWATGPEGLAHRGAIGFTRVTPTGHNGFIDILLYAGWVGMILKVALVLTLLSQAGRLASIPSAYGWLVLSIAVFIILHNLLESDLMISTNPLSMLALLFLFCAIRATSAGRTIRPARGGQAARPRRSPAT